MYYTNTNTTNCKTKQQTYNAIYADYQAPIKDNLSSTQVNRSRYIKTPIPNTNPPKFSSTIKRPQRNPIQHYRRQYSRTQNNRSYTNIGISIMDTPGKTIINLTDNETNNIPCPDDRQFFIEKITKDGKCNELNARMRLKTSNTNINNTNNSNNINNTKPYCSSIRAFRELQGDTYGNNKCHKSQHLVKRTIDCTDNTATDTEIEFITNKRGITNGSTSITNYRRQFTKKYNEQISLSRYNNNNNNNNNNKSCCNLGYNNRDWTNCDPHIYPNFTHKKNICVDLKKKL
jgi:hypothetical protein